MSGFIFLLGLVGLKFRMNIAVGLMNLGREKTTEQKISYH